MYKEPKTTEKYEPSSSAGAFVVTLPFVLLMTLGSVFLMLCLVIK